MPRFVIEPKGCLSVTLRDPTERSVTPDADAGMFAAVKLHGVLCVTKVAPARSPEWKPLAGYLPSEVATTVRQIVLRVWLA